MNLIYSRIIIKKETTLLEISTVISRKMQPEKSFFDSKKTSLNQTNLCIAVRSKKAFFDLNKFLDCFFSLNLRNEFLCSCISTCVMLNKRNIFFNLKKKLSSFKVIRINKLFIKFLSVFYLNQINIFLNQINNVKKIICFI